MHGPIDGSDLHPASEALSGGNTCYDSGFTQVAKSKNPFWQVSLKGTCTINKVTVGAKGNIGLLIYSLSHMTINVIIEITIATIAILFIDFINRR